MHRPLTHCSSKSHFLAMPPPASAPCLLLTRPSQGTEGLGEVSGPCAGGPWGTQAGTRDKPMFGFVAGWLAARQECAGSRIPAPSAADGANWKQSISLV